MTVGIKVCEHGLEIGANDGVTQDDIESCEGDERLLMGLLEFYSACDCCDTLMHHSTIAHGYFVMKDGRTLCHPCALTEKRQDFDGAFPKSGQAVIRAGGSMTELSDAEVVCEFMEARPKPTLEAVINGAYWWTPTEGHWEPIRLTLDFLHLVEAKLTDRQWRHYCNAFLDISYLNGGPGVQRRSLHATAEQKLKALAAVLRGAGAAH